MKGREIEPSVLFRWDTGERGDEATDWRRQGFRRRGNDPSWCVTVLTDRYSRCRRRDPSQVHLSGAASNKVASASLLDVLNIVPTTQHKIAKSQARGSALTQAPSASPASKMGHFRRGMACLKACATKSAGGLVPIGFCVDDSRCI